MGFIIYMSENSQRINVFKWSLYEKKKYVLKKGSGYIVISHNQEKGRAVSL